MKNISSASLLALGFLSFVFSFAFTLNVFDAQHIFSINAALAASTSTADLSGTVYEGDTVSVGNPGKGGIVIELYDNGALMPDQVVTAGDGTFSVSAVSGVTSVCIVIPAGYQLNSNDDCYFYPSTATGNITNIDFTIGLVPAGVQTSSTLNVMGKIVADAGALTPIPAGLVTIEIRDDGANALATTTTNDRAGLFAVNLVPAAYTACVIVPGGYGLIAGDRCQSVDFASNSDVTLNDVTLSTYPVITRSGESTLTMDFGSDYIDAGATASKDGRDLTSLISVSGLPDTSVAGLYIVTYAVSDPNTLLSATTTRVVTVSPKRESSHGGSGSSSGGAIGGYYLSSSPVATSPSIAPTATTSTSTVNSASSTVTGTLAVSDLARYSEEYKAKKDYLRKRALGNVLGAETEASGTPVTISTSALEKLPIESPKFSDYLKPILVILAFGGVVGGLWWWKKGRSRIGA